MNITTDLIGTWCQYLGLVSGVVEKETTVYTIHGVIKPDGINTCCLVESHDNGRFYILEYIKLKRHNKL